MSFTKPVFVLLLLLLFSNSIMGQCPPSNPPYNEGFESISAINQLPLCMVTTSLGSANTTYTGSASGNRIPRTGSCFASFSSSVSGTTYFFSAPINLLSGVTYSTGCYWITNPNGGNNWQSLSLLVGPNQNSSGMQVITSTNTPVSPIYKPLSSTFTVATSGVYYLAIAANGTTGTAPYLSIDDLFLTVPCIGVNIPTVNLLSSSTNVCQNESFTLSASGADLYSWSPATSNSVVTSLSNAGVQTLIVTGTKTLTNCVSIQTLSILVRPLPQYSVSFSPSFVCVGETTTMSVNPSQLTYTWSTGANTNSIVVTPSVQNAYNISVTGTNNCVATKTVQVTVDLCSDLSNTTHSKEEFSMFPSPVNGLLNIQIPLSSESPILVSIHDMAGKKVKNFEFHPRSNPTNSFLLDLSLVEPGIYFLTAQSGEISFKPIKFVVVH